MGDPRAPPPHLIRNHHITASLQTHIVRNYPNPERVCMAWQPEDGLVCTGLLGHSLHALRKFLWVR